MAIFSLQERGEMLFDRILLETRQKDFIIFPDLPSITNQY